MKKSKYLKCICMVLVFCLIFSMTSFAMTNYSNNGWNNTTQFEIVNAAKGEENAADIEVNVPYEVNLIQNEGDYGLVYFRFVVPGPGGYIRAQFDDYNSGYNFYDEDFKRFDGRFEGGKTYFFYDRGDRKRFELVFTSDEEGDSIDEAIPLACNEKKYGTIDCDFYWHDIDYEVVDVYDYDYFSFIPKYDGYYTVETSIDDYSFENDNFLVDEFGHKFKFDANDRVYLEEGKQYFWKVTSKYHKKYWVRVSNIPVESIKLDNYKLSLNSGASKKLSYIVNPKEASCKDVSFRSKDTSIAVVSSNGVVRGKKAGKTTIICEAKDGCGATAKCTVIVKPKKPVITSTSKVLKVKTKVTWRKVDNATGYDVYRATSKTGKYSKVASVKGTTYTSGKLKKNKYYYYKIKAYTLIDGQKYYSDYSTYKSIKTGK